MQVLKEKTKYGRLTEKTPTNYPFNLRNDKPATPDTYKEDYNYCILLIDPQTQKTVDIRIVKTTATLEKFMKDKHGRHNLDILFHPNPLKLTSNFWEQYRQAQSGSERLKLFSVQKVLADINMLFIDTITIDVDSPFEQAIEVLNELTKELNIPAEILQVKKTKSGNLRFSFSITPIKPNTLNKNGKTNLQNVKEFVSIINSYFKTKGLKADDSFKRINHPIWITKSEQLILEATTEIDFYTLYREAKKLNKKLRQQQEKKKEKENQVKLKRRLVYLPAFVANKFRHIEYKTALEKAVETLAKRNKKGRYIHLLQPVAGWCKYLGLTYHDFYDLVYPYARDKQEDIKKAWKYARPLEFKEYTKERKYDLVKYAEKALDYLKENGPTARQELLKEIFDNQSWLEQLIMLELKQQGLIIETFEKNPAGVGRPIKIYSINESIFKMDNEEKKDLKDKKLANPCKIRFRQKYNSLFRESILEGVGYAFSLVEGDSFFDNRYSMLCYYSFGDNRILRSFTMAEERKGSGQVQQKKKQNKQGGSLRVENYVSSLDGQDVEIHVAYGNTVLQLQGRIKTKAKYDVILEFMDDDGKMQRIIINKAYVVMVKPL